MTERPLADRLDDTVGAILAGADATAALRDAELAPLARLAADLRHYPSPAFKTRLREHLKRRTTMTPAEAATPVATTTALRAGFTTVTPYLRAPEAGLVEFLTRTFGARETFSARGGGGGIHREVRIGDSMIMIGEGGPDSGTPLRPAFHVFVDDVDAAYARAVAAGGTPLGEPTDRPYGERAGFVADRFGNRWFIATALGPQSVAGALRTVTPFLRAAKAADYITFLQRALGAVEETRHEEGGRFLYGRIRVGDAALELGEGEGDGEAGQFLLYVSDPDASYQRALDAGARSIMPMTDQPYGRMGGVQDGAGNVWFFQRPSAADLAAPAR